MRTIIRDHRGKANSIYQRKQEIFKKELGITDQDFKDLINYLENENSDGKIAFLNKYKHYIIKKAFFMKSNEDVVGCRYNGGPIVSKEYLEQKMHCIDGSELFSVQFYNRKRNDDLQLKIKNYEKLIIESLSITDSISILEKDINSNNVIRSSIINNRIICSNNFKTNLIKFHPVNICGICGIHYEKLEAAHILDKFRCVSQDEIEDHFNGILLCPNCHTYLDNDIINIKEDFKIYVTSESNYIHEAYYNKKLNKSYQSLKRKEYIKKRNEAFEIN